MIESDQNTTQARKPFRILAGLIALLCIFNLFSSVEMIRAGYYRSISNLLVNVIFGLEFGFIALRGDGLWMYKAKHFKKRKSK